MVANKLSVNPNKMEYLLLFNPNPKHFNNPNCSINIDSNIISPNDSAKNLGVVFQSDTSMDKHISAVVKSSFLQLRDFHRSRPLISKTAAITLTLYIPILTTVIVFFMVFITDDSYYLVPVFCNFF